MKYTQPLKCVALAGLLLLPADADPVPVRHVQGYLHGFIVLKDLDDKILASGDLIQLPAGNRVTTTLDLHFRDGSLHHETAVFSQRRTYQLISYKQIQKGPAFKAPQTLSFDTGSGKVNVEYRDKDGSTKTVAEQVSLPPDMANGLLPMLISEADPKAEITLSMLVATPKPRVVTLKVSTSGRDTFSVGGSTAEAIHYLIKIEIGGITGVAAKVVGKQPPPIHMWIAAGNAPVFLKSEGPLYENGPIWRIELPGLSWPKASPKQ
jgi:hypothetical protein